ncbi:DUF4936 family protein [Collimonas sp.]|jgi:hypothetical protein|uniref:DUF4936 family protein n=1 Tax=Collimonas sp. TaxID=1963772 RepID=UPI0037BECE21
MSNDLYVYYWVAAAKAQQFHSAATAMQAGLSQQYRVVSALKRRPEIEDDRHTWMEVYASVPPDFAQIVEQAAVQHELARFIEGPRHSELFANISSCA